MLRRTISRIYRHIFPLIKNETLLVLGDSHAAVFDHWWFRLSFPTKAFETCIVGGATASGLENPNSRTQAGALFDEALNKRRYDKRIIVLLGEVDTGFVIWYRAEKYHASVSEMLTQAVTNYTRLLTKIKQYGSPIVISTPLPTIQDNTTWGEVANLRRKIHATQLERTILTLQFNQAVKQFCNDNGISFVSLDAESLGRDGLVNPQLKNRDPCNHHYDSFRYARLLSRKLGPLLR